MSFLVVYDTVSHILTFLNDYDSLRFIHCQKNTVPILSRLAYDYSLKSCIRYSHLMALDNPKFRVTKLLYDNNYKPIYTLKRKFLQFEFPSTVTDLQFDDDFNHPLPKNVFPKTLQRLKFGKKFNQCVDGLIIPASTQELVFGVYFNQPIQNLIFERNVDQDEETGLKRLIFPRTSFFKQSLQNVLLPDSIEVLEVGDFFNQDLKGFKLPMKLKNVYLHSSTDLPLPPSLEVLKLGHGFKTIKPNWIPNTVVQLELVHNPTELVEMPSNIKSLIVGVDYSMDYDLITSTLNTTFPISAYQTLEKLSIPCFIPVKQFYNLISLIIDSIPVHTTCIELPVRLERLSIFRFDVSMNLSSIPNSLVYLDLFSRINIDILNQIQSNTSIKNLALRDAYPHTLFDLRRTTLSQITINNMDDDTKMKYPKSLKKMIIGKHYASLFRFPPTVTNLKMTGPETNLTLRNISHLKKLKVLRLENVYPYFGTLDFILPNNLQKLVLTSFVSIRFLNSIKCVPKRLKTIQFTIKHVAWINRIIQSSSIKNLYLDGVTSKNSCIDEIMHNAPKTLRKLMVNEINVMTPQFDPCNIKPRRSKRNISCTTSSTENIDTGSMDRKKRARLLV